MQLAKQTCTAIFPTFRNDSWFSAVGYAVKMKSRMKDWGEGQKAISIVRVVGLDC